MDNFQKDPARPLAVIFADARPLTLKLIEFLRSNSCQVVLVNGIGDWSHFQPSYFSSNVFVIEQKDIVNLEANYTIVLSEQLDTIEKLQLLKNAVESALTISKKDESKFIVVTKYFQEPSLVQSTNDLSKYAIANHSLSVVLYYDQIVDLEHNEEKTDEESNFSNSEFVLQNEYYPILSDDLINEIGRNIFSFGNFGKRIAVIGEKGWSPQENQININSSPGRLEESYHQPLEVDDVVKKNTDQKIIDLFKIKLGKILEKKDQKIINKSRETAGDIIENLPKLSVGTSTEVLKAEIKETEVSQKEVIDGNLSSNSISTQSKLDEKSILLPIKFEEDKKDIAAKQSDQKTRKEKRKDRILKSREKLRVLKKLKWSTLSSKLAILFGTALVFVVFLPFFIIFLSIVVTIIVFKLNLSIEDNIAFAKAATAISNVSYNYNLSQSKMPLFGNIFLTQTEIAYDIREINEINKTKKGIESLLVDLITVISEKEQKNVVDLSNRLAVEFDYLNKKLKYLEAETKYAGGIEEKVFQRFNKYNFQKSKVQSEILSDLSYKLPDILGVGKPRRYLLVNQNDLVVRPTGGEINSFVVATFSGGRLIDTTYFSASDIDSQIKGLVEAPSVLKKYFSEETWSVRNANWSVDFETAITQIEWFLNKSVNIDVDGVALVLPDVYIDILNELGEVEVPNRDNITASNFGEVIARETEGSDTDTLTVLFDQFLKSSFTNKEKVSIVETIFMNLENNVIDFKFKDEGLQRHINNLSWSGNNQASSCNDNCYNDTVKVVESTHLNGNLSTANRNSLVNIYLERGLVKRELLYTIENTSSTHTFNTYLRLVVPPDSGFENIKVISKSGISEYKPELIGEKAVKTAGIYISIPKGETYTVVYKWESGTKLDFTKIGEYSLNIFPQPGIDDLTMEATIAFPESVSYFLSNSPTLTLTGATRYNTKLVHDIKYRFNW